MADFKSNSYSYIAITETVNSVQINTKYQIELYVLDRNTWYYITENKQMCSGFFKLLPTKLFVYKFYIFDMYRYKQNLALNNRHGVDMP